MIYCGIKWKTGHTDSRCAIPRPLRWSCTRWVNDSDGLTTATDVRVSSVVRADDSFHVRASSQSRFSASHPLLRSDPSCSILSFFFFVYSCVYPSYLNPSYYSHGCPCQGEICSLTVNGPILTTRPLHQRSVFGLRFAGLMLSLKGMGRGGLACWKTVLTGNLCKC